tara:strand:- start:8 stop:229 length:222 start_codon:yes stop_codon:yes gene_type:complete
LSKVPAGKTAIYGTFFIQDLKILFPDWRFIILVRTSITTKCKGHRVFLINNRVLKKAQKIDCPTFVVLLEVEA